MVTSPETHCPLHFSPPSDMAERETGKGGSAGKHEGQHPPPPWPSRKSLSSSGLITPAPFTPFSYSNGRCSGEATADAEAVSAKSHKQFHLAQALKEKQPFVHPPEGMPPTPATKIPTLPSGRAENMSSSPAKASWRQSPSLPRGEMQCRAGRPARVPTPNPAKTAFD